MGTASRKHDAIVATHGRSTGLASAVAGTQAPAAVMALNSYFSAGERLELSYLADTKDESVCLAVEGNSNVRQDSTNVIVWDCEASRGKTWELDHSQSHGSHFQIKYTGPTQESFDLCVAGQTPGGSRDFGEGSQFYLWRCMPNDPTQQFQFVGARHPSRTGGRAMSWPAWKSTSASGALSHFSAMTRPSWLSRAARNRHRHAIEQASRRWRGGRRCDSARPRRKILISTQVLAPEPQVLPRRDGLPERGAGPGLGVQQEVSRAPDLADLVGAAAHQRAQPRAQAGAGSPWRRSTA